MTRTILVTPTQSVDGLPFGASRQAVRTHFDSGYEIFTKSRFSKNTTDNYGALHVFYTVEDTLEAIEIFPEMRVQIGEQVLPGDYQLMRNWLLQQDPGAKEDTSGLVSERLSIGVYQENGVIGSITFGGAGYYQA